MPSLHLIDVVGAALGLALAIVFRRQLRSIGRRAYQRWRRRVFSTIDGVFGPVTRIRGEKSLPFYVMVTLPEAGYLGIVTFRKFTIGRARGRKRVQLHAYVMMEKGEQIPLPPALPDEPRDAGALYSFITPHAETPEDAAEQVARHVTGLRLHRAGWRWIPDMEKSQ